MRVIGLDSLSQQRFWQNRFRVTAVVFVLFIVGLLYWGIQLARSPKYATWRYLCFLDLDRFTRSATDWINPRLSPLRLGKPLEELDVIYDYDFERLNQVAEKLKHVDRRRVLAAIFQQLTRDCKNDLQRHIAITRFCDRAGFHNLIQPMWPDRECVYDPLILLELGEQRCGQSARLASDLFAAVGYRTRLAQVGLHVTAEVFYDDDWHLLEVGLFGNGAVPFDDDGAVPSILELSHRPELLDALPHGQEGGYENAPISCSIEYPSMGYFNAIYYAASPPTYSEKAATRRQERNRHYGWNYNQQMPGDWQISEMPRRYLPGAPQNISMDGKHIRWTPAADLDGDLLGYRVYIGSQSRGWCYGPDWQPEMYARRFEEPPRDIALIETREPQIDLNLHAQHRLYVTVMPFDLHGETVGRRIYPASEEIIIRSE